MQLCSKIFFGEGRVSAMWSHVKSYHPSICDILRNQKICCSKTPPLEKLDIYFPPSKINDKLTCSLCHHDIKHDKIDYATKWHHIETCHPDVSHHLYCETPCLCTTDPVLIDQSTFDGQIPALSAENNEMSNVSEVKQIPHVDQISPFYSATSNDKKLKCRLCAQEIVKGRKHNMWSHLQNKHLDICKQLCHSELLQNSSNTNVELQSNTTKLKKNERTYGRDLDECYTKFTDSFKDGPVYICTVCQQTWFVGSVKIFDVNKFNNKKFAKSCQTGYYTFDEKEYICNTCFNALKATCVPKFSVKNGFHFRAR